MSQDKNQMSQPYKDLHKAVDAMVTAWAMRVSDLKDDPEQVEAVAQFEFGDLRVEATFKAVGFKDGRKLTKAALNGILNPSQEPEQSR